MNVKNRISQYIELRTQRSDGDIKVVPVERQRYKIVEQRAAEALQIASHLHQFRRQFRYLLSVIGEWVEKQKDLRDAYVTLADGSLLFVAVRNKVEFSEEFDDSLSSLDLQIANDPVLDLLEFNTLALPDVSDDALQQFLHPEMTMVYDSGEA